MKNFKITANDNMKRIDNFLMKLLPHLSRNEIFSLLRNNKVKVNGKKTKHDYRLSFNDSIDIYLNDQYFQTETNDLFKLTKNDLNIIFEDENILLLNKPIGLITHEDNKENIHTLLNKLKLYMFESKQ
jgi:23S rRNA pseudouridine955/2504/2580 synthase